MVRDVELLDNLLEDVETLLQPPGSNMRIFREILGLGAGLSPNRTEGRHVPMEIWPLRIFSTEREKEMRAVYVPHHGLELVTPFYPEGACPWNFVGGESDKRRQFLCIACFHKLPQVSLVENQA